MHGWATCHEVFQQRPADLLWELRRLGWVHCFQDGWKVMLYEGRPSIVGCTLELLQQVPHNLIGLCCVPDPEHPFSKCDGDRMARRGDLGLPRFHEQAWMKKNWNLWFIHN